MPSLSIVIPAHDVDAYIERCLSSILDVDNPQLEVVVVDDGSADGTAAILNKVASQDSRVHVITNTAAAGPGAARNRGFAATSGSFVWFIDADDWLFPDAVEIVLQRLHQELDILFVDFARVDESDQIIPSASRPILLGAPSGSFTLSQWPSIVNVMHTPWNKIVRRDFFISAGLLFSTGVFEDVSYTYLALLSAKAIEVEQRVCYAYRVRRPGALTSTFGPQHLAWSDQWSRVLKAATDQPAKVRDDLFKRMTRSGRAVFNDPVRVGGSVQREFFRRYTSLYRSEKRTLSTQPWRRVANLRDIDLITGSWALARVRLEVFGLWTRMRRQRR